jgi:hypothetical protein
MAQIITLVCDQHLQAGDGKGGGLDVPAATYLVGLTLPGGRPQQWQVDLCEECAKALHVVADFLSDVGRPVAGQAPRQPKAPRGTVGTSAAAVSAGAGAVSRTTRRPKPEYGPDGRWHCPEAGCDKTAPTEGALRDHTKRIHGKSLTLYRGAKITVHCPECQAGFTSRQGLGTHRRGAHGVTAGHGAASG